MMHTFPELTFGGVLIAPFVLYSAAALVIYLLLRPFLYLINFAHLFSNPPMAQLCVYVLILTTLVVFF